MQRQNPFLTFNIFKRDAFFESTVILSQRRFISDRAFSFNLNILKTFNFISRMVKVRGMAHERPGQALLLLCPNRVSSRKEASMCAPCTSSYQKKSAELAPNRIKFQKIEGKLYFLNYDTLTSTSNLRTFFFLDNCFQLEYGSLFRTVVSKRRLASHMRLVGPFSKALSQNATCGRALPTLSKVY